MDLHAIRQEMKAKSIYDMPLRVTFYARVSSEKDEQLNSLDNQISYYTEFIKNNKNWAFVEGYIDEGLSGISTLKRENFHNMIRDGESGKFDLVVTKEISRFARNTLDSISFTRQLLASNVGVFFQNDNINTFDEDSELRLTIMASIAQDELRKLSSRIRFGHQQAIKNNVVLGNSRMFGYDKDNKKLKINEPEAQMVRQLFELYATNEYSMKQIENILWDRGYRNRNGNKISHSTISNTISNPKYKGYYVGNKVKIVDMFTKKQKFLPPEEWIMFKDETGDIVPAIVSEELWETANAVLKKRSRDVKSRQNKCNHANLLTGKLYCSHCGKAYYRRESKSKNGKANSKWICSGKINNGADSCPSFAIYEDEIKPILFEVFRETSIDSEKLIDRYIEMYKSLEETNNFAKEIKKLKKRIETENRKKSKLLGYNVSGQLSDRDFLSMNNECTKNIEKAEIELLELEKQQNSRSEFKTHIDTIRKVLRQAGKDAQNGIINKAFIEKYIDRIYATPEKNVAEASYVRLEIKIFTGEDHEKFISKPAVRSGHTFKKMVQAYENGLK
ncbi:MAG: recombinase family protein [Firmicutes bacterium]|nr:recombinase family protein [Bacillota bacterium]